MPKLNIGFAVDRAGEADSDADVHEDDVSAYDLGRFAESARFVRHYPEQNPVLRELSPSIATPAQIVAGREDDLVPWSNNEYLADLLPNSQLHLLDAGHFAWEQASDAWTARPRADLGNHRRLPAARWSGDGLGPPNGRGGAGTRRAGRSRDRGVRCRADAHPVLGESPPAAASTATRRSCRSSRCSGGTRSCDWSGGTFPIPSSIPARTLPCSSLELAATNGGSREAHSLLLTGRRQFSRDALLEIAEQLELERDEAVAVFEERAFRERAVAYVAEGRRAGALGTPTFFLDQGQRL